MQQIVRRTLSAGRPARRSDEQQPSDGTAIFRHQTHLQPAEVGFEQHPSPGFEQLVKRGNVSGSARSFSPSSSVASGQA